MSHVLQLALPPLFVLLKSEFDVSYAALGAIMSVFYLASGVCQFGAGFAVDRFGARPVLFAGMGLLASCTVIAGLAPSFAWLYVLAALMGIGNGVFHPADFAILNARVQQARLGHAYSLHGVGGSLGFAIAPVCSYALASAFGWRAALMVMGAAAFVLLAIMIANSRDLYTQGHGGKPVRGTISSMDLFRQAPILLCFAFFLIYNMGSISVQTFVAPALHAAYSTPLAVATSALTGYLLGSAAGIVTGGFLASSTQHHDRVAGAGLAVGALIIASFAVLQVPAGATLPLLVLAGFALGSTGPSRDMIVRKATPAGASGRAYGFVYSGLDIGATVAPIVAGSLLDHGTPRLVFIMIATCLLLGMGTVLEARRRVSFAAAAVP
ncbi:MAG: MFS transporter [Pseudomonadota bacterium]|nr:MFS transporter [Pseudomonadota bacterium]